MKTIIVATDFSPSSLNAANYAADMALFIHADILLLHVCQLPISYSEIPVPIDVEDAEVDIERALNEIKSQLVKKTNGKLRVRTNVKLGVFFYQELRTVCRSTNPYAVVMGSQGTSASERLFFGGHTVHAVKHLKWPIITVPPGVTFSPIKKIGFASDFSDVLKTTPLDEIMALVNDFDAELHILHTESDLESNPNADFESRLLAEMLEPLKPKYHIIANKNADDGIINFAEKNKIDLLIVLPKMHDLLDSFLHKSHSKQMVLRSHVPVMALHQQ